MRATLAILAERGLAAWTTAALADRVGLSEAALFRHFDSKDSILSAALRRQAEELRARIDAYVPEAGSPWREAVGLAREVLAYLEETEGGPLVVLLGHAARMRPEMRDEVERTGARFRGRLVALLAGDGQHAAEEVAPLADLVVAVVQSACLRWSIGGHDGPLAARAEPLLDRLGGLLDPCD